MPRKKIQRERRLTVISQRRPWDDAAFARVVVAYVLHDLKQKQQSDVSAPVERREREDAS